MLRHSAQAAAGLTLAASCAPLFAAADERRFKIGACDWSIGKMDNPQAFEVAKQIGLDGVQISLGTVARPMHLCQPEVQQQFKDAAKKAGLQIASLAIGELNEVPYKSDPRTVEWVSSAIDVCQALGLHTILLAFFGNDDLRDDPAGVDEVVRRLKAVENHRERGLSCGEGLLRCL
jgi:sugar phosphate isomerase/epimerase